LKNEAELVGFQIIRTGSYMEIKKTECSIFRKCGKELASSFSMIGDASCCSSIDEVVKTLGDEHKPGDW
jgi:hypothetical protein